MIAGDNNVCCNNVQATDESFLEKCHQQHGDNPCYEKPKQRIPVFSISHYAGQVKYQVKLKRFALVGDKYVKQVATFLDKNRDAVRPDLLELLQGSSCKVCANNMQ